MKKWSLFFGMFLVSACATDEFIVPDGQAYDKGNHVTIRISFADASPQASTRALTVADENRIDSLQVFIFKKGATTDRLDDIYAYRTGVSRDSFPSNLTDHRATIAVASSTDEQRFILVANSPALNLQLVEGVTKARELIEQLRFSGSGYGNSSEKYWKATPTYFPMWGETGLFPTLPPIVNINMVRAVARIEVGVDINNPAGNDPALGFGSIFKIDSLYLCHVNDSGYIATGKKLPNTKVDVGYKFVGDSERSMLRTIYAPETDSLTDTHTPAFLIVKAAYYHPDSTHYYRIDFTNGNEYKPLLRNRTYTINITGIRSVGYRTLAEAKNAPVLSLNPKLILGDNEQYINELAYTNQYWLGTYATNVKLDWYQQSGDLPVGTSYPGGWKAELIAGSPWFTLSNTSGGSGVGDLHYILADNLTGQSRTATIKLSAGTLSQLIHFTQSPGSNTYVITQGTTARIPLASANIDGINRASTITSAVSYDLFSNTANIGTSIQGGVVQTPNYPTEGVYQIQAVSNGTVVWGWTVWVVSTAVYDSINTPLHYNGYSFMDRNLGALSSNNDRRAGLYYQWGRKDPASPYTTNTFLAPSIMPAPSGMDEIEIAKHPNTFYTSTEAPYDWMTNGQHNNLWTTIEGEKGIYDPCPFGWRVPAAANDGVSPLAGFTNSVNGIQFHIGTRSGYSGTNGSPINTAKAIVWGASARGTSAYIYNVTDVSPGSARRTDAYPIRCVRDVKRPGY